MSYYAEKIERLEAENARLKAEVERLRAGVETMTYHAPGVETTQWVRAVEYDRLKAQVERLTKAGDAMASQLYAFGYNTAWDFWNRAKQGGQP